MTISITQLENQLRNLSGSISESLTQRADPSLYDAAFSNNRQHLRAIGQEIGGFVAMSPGTDATLQYSFDRIPPVISRADGERIYEVFPEYLGDEIPEGIRRGIAALESDDYILQAGGVTSWPDYYDSLDIDQQRVQPVEEIITGDFPLATTSVLETIFEDAYSRDEIVNGLTRETARIDVQGMVRQATDVFNMVTPETPEGALGRVGQIGSLLEERNTANEEQVLQFLQNFNLGGFFSNIGIFGGLLNDLEKAVGEFTTIFGDIQSRVTNIVPAISDALIDDVARVIDPAIRDTLKIALDISSITDNQVADILRPLVNGNIQGASEIIANFPTGLTDIGEISDLLSGLEIDPMKIIEGFSVQPDNNTREILGQFSSWNGAATNLLNSRSAEEIQPRAGNTTTSTTDDTYVFDYVDTAEEFEADISSSTRDITRVIFHFVEAPAGRDPDANTVHGVHSQGGFDGMQYHYLIRRTGRVQRGRPISSPGVSGENSVDIAFVGSTRTQNPDGGEEVAGILNEATNVAQQRSYREMMTAFFRVFPGADVELGEIYAERSETYENAASVPESREIANRVSRQSPGIAAGFNPGLVSNCVHGRGGGTVHSPGGAGTGSVVGGGGAGIIPYSGPGVSTSNTLTGNTANVDNRLMQVFEESMAAVGLRGVVSSGYRPIVNGNRDTVGSTSGRHQGFAIDLGLYSGDTLLSIQVPEHLSLIQEFCRVYVNNCVGRGYTPGIGMMSPQRRYMGPTTHHFDIARTLETGSRANLSGNSSNYWVQTVPSWLVGIFNDAGLGPTSRTNGPSGGVSMSTLMAASGGVLAS
jgi:hypothetical protein